MTTLPLRRAHSRHRWLALLLALIAGTLASLSTAAAPPSEADTASRLVGVFRLSAGSCKGGKIAGTYLRMILPSGTVNGPYMSNGDSPCSDQSYTPLGPGVDGGLSTVAHQAAPQPAFDSAGNARANRITAPAQYYGTAFTTATAAKEPQTGRSVPVPTVTLRGDKLTADLRAFTVSWNKQYFNQGAPKPDGSTPGNTKVATGTYDRATGRFTLEWASQVQGGPFDRFTGKWHLEGVFVPAVANGAGSPGSTQQGSASAGSGSAANPGQAQPGAAVPGAAVPGTAVPGTAVPGQAPVAGAPVAGAPAAGAPVAGAPVAGAPVPVAGATAGQTITQRHTEWRVSGPLTAFAIGLAVVALGLVVGTRVLERRGARKAAAS
ncbi:MULTISPECIES: hypothetical protein [unclassified Nocardioides]|uniref:hypothetical protein n=1 Tax=unclassified Nocardioides TaxID=2615069 RepID=UPI0006F4DCB4|nr:MULTISPECIES: hypothetical protein [unclassified Nocardioides]KRA38853.1 hypothetical protein ASD81_09755 [Nocardioides sp. Root614]KRA92813.1 hypothetical protein ASD84_10020 [Nocardioides sp. Root682]